ncbi:MAG: hypothetical protein HF312_11025 [Ignavibacteria bacterium]|nr:hypothetical protein [Ignavibacteria bacterium]
MLDHGVMGGLVLLHFSTFYMIYHFILEDIYSKNPDPIIEKFIGEPNGDCRNNYCIQWWWEGILWGTAATAFHNYFQAKIPKIKRLNINEDPITYLGILVDILQEWDRYSVFSNPFNSDSNTLQGIDVELERVNGMIRINYHNEKISREIRKALNKSLIGWNNIVEVC